MVVKSPLKPDGAAAATLISGEELFQRGDIGVVELVKGEIVSMAPTGLWHGRIENKFGAILTAFVEQHQLGVVAVGEVGLYTSRNPDTVRGVDALFISHQRLAQVKSKSYLDVAPELVVEVMSLSDRWNEVTDKLEEYFNCGVLSVWVANPQKHQVYVYHALTDVQRFSADDFLVDDEVLPSFRVRVAELFGVKSV